jgi:DNA-binding transcriptional LysR family regulator
MIALIAHIRTGRWAGVVPEKLASLLGQGEAIRSIPIVSPDATHTIGLVVPDRDPLTPLCAALVREARAVAEPGLVPKDSHAEVAPVVA